MKRRVIYPKNQRLIIHLMCTHCGRDLFGDMVRAISFVPAHGMRFIYTQDDHQLCYHGVDLETIHCMSEPEKTRKVG